MINPSLHKIDKKIGYNSRLIVGKKVLFKSILYTWKKPWAIKHALYHAILLLSGEYFTLNIYVNLTAFLFESR